MDEIKQFIKTYFHDIQKKENKIKTLDEAYSILLQISLFHIKKTPQIFDWRRYIQTYPDLRRNLKNSKDASWHYLLYGIRERRKAYILNSDEVYKHEFNWKDYIAINKDLNYITCDIDAFRHYIEQGHLQHHQITIKEQTIINDRIEITDNEEINNKWLKILTKNISSLVALKIKEEETQLLSKSKPQEETQLLSKSKPQEETQLLSKSKPQEETQLLSKSKPQEEKQLLSKYDFKLPSHNDNQMRLIYCGNLGNEENILEIIDEFQKIHANNPKIVLTIVYDKICNSTVEFTNKINNYIKNGVSGITFKHNLSHRDSCYEIAISDIGICWHKNGELSTKVREYENYNLPIINSKQIFDIFYKKSLYVFASFEKRSGYFQRTLHILSEKKDLLGCYNPFNLPIKENKFDDNNNNNNNIILHFTRNKFLHLIKILNIKNIILPSNFKNFHSLYDNLLQKLKYKPKFIYEIRGLWCLTRHAFDEYNEKKRLPFSTRIENEIKSERSAIKKADSVIFINNTVRDYLLNDLKFHEINTKPYILLYNSFSTDNLNIIKRKPNKIYKIGYFGTINSYEGIELLVEVCNLINKNNSIQLIICGNKNTEINLNKYDFIEYHEFIPYEQYIQKIQEIDLLCIPRLNYKVCEIIPALKPLAAMAYKIPILVPNFPCYNEMSQEGFYFFESENSNSLKQTIEKIMKNTDHSIKIDKNYKLVLDTYNWKTQCNKITDLM